MTVPAKRLKRIFFALTSSVIPRKGHLSVEDTQYGCPKGKYCQNSS